MRLKLSGKTFQNKLSKVIILYALEDFNRRNRKTFVEPLTFTFQLSKCNVPRNSSTNLHLYKTLVKKINLETIHLQKLNQRIIVMAHVHQVIIF